jgi:hypothetical protein
MLLYLSVLEAVRQLVGILSRLAHRGERSGSAQSRTPELHPLRPGRPKTLGEMLASLPRLTPEEVDSFAEDLQKVRAELNRLPLQDPWGV